MTSIAPSPLLVLWSLSVHLRSSFMPEGKRGTGKQRKREGRQWERERRIGRGEKGRLGRVRENRGRGRETIGKREGIGRGKKR